MSPLVPPLYTSSFTQSVPAQSLCKLAAVSLLFQTVTWSPIPPALPSAFLFWDDSPSHLLGPPLYLDLTLLLPHLPLDSVSSEHDVGVRVANCSTSPFNHLWFLLISVVRWELLREQTHRESFSTLCPISQNCGQDQRQLQGLRPLRRSTRKIFVHCQGLDLGSNISWKNGLAA